MIGVALLLEADPPRAIRSMVEKWVPSLPYVSTFMARVGQIVGTPENCRRLLEAEEAILVFPEGVRGIGKLWPQRYQLQDFGLGFMRLALETDTPIVPIAVVGAEEQAPALMDVKPLAKLLGFPSFPLTVTGLPLPAAHQVPHLLRGAAALHGPSGRRGHRAGQEGPHREVRHPVHAQPGPPGAPGRLLVKPPARAP